MFAYSIDLYDLYIYNSLKESNLTGLRNCGKYISHFPTSPFFQKNMNLLHLPKELKLCIAAYFNDTEKIAFGSCCVGFYNELLMNHLRHFKIQNRSNFLVTMKAMKKFAKDLQSVFDFLEVKYM